ncbi:hypothetical protein E2C01_078044 [Portunus trituberculatus]|uniref:Uncharacterized protein n=1 Tax=Portunus trituberculatus TaxID=210409 RepID=A0A5B7INW1_PORTR|nr:hypothetical protein [Portunus trituberculatus]
MLKSSGKDKKMEEKEYIATIEKIMKWRKRRTKKIQRRDGRSKRVVEDYTRRRKEDTEDECKIREGTCMGEEMRERHGRTKEKSRSE